MVLRHSLVAALVLVLGLSGCADMALTAGGAENDAEPTRASGQTVLFVGTDPITFATDLYLAQALSDDGVEGGGLADAVAFELEALTSLDRAGVDPLLPSSTDALFGDEAPFPVPDRGGNRVAVLISGMDEGTGEDVGRVLLIDRASGELTVGPDVPGLARVRFSWNGGRLILDAGGPEASTWLVADPADLEAGPTPLDELVELSSGESLADVGLLRGGDDLLLTIRGEQADRLLRWNDEATVEVAAADEGRIAWTTSSDTWLAWVRSVGDGLRRIEALPFASSSGVAEPASDPALDCTWPTWEPVPEGRLAYVCETPDEGVADVRVWTPASKLEPDALDLPLVTGLGSSLAVRSRPQWDPAGDRLIVGLSSGSDVAEGQGMALWAVGPSTSPRLLWDAVGDAGWAHFSAATTEGELLVWDRAQSGLQDSAGGHPIQVIATHADPPRIGAVTIGRDLLVSYPMFLGANQMLYP